jgi:hypothetical protein
MVEVPAQKGIQPILIASDYLSECGFIASGILLQKLCIARLVFSFVALYQTIPLKSF